MKHSGETAHRLWTGISLARRRIEERLSREVASHGLSLTEYGVLEALEGAGKVPTGEVGSRVLLTSGSMTYVIDKLVRRGLIRRFSGNDDRRIVLVELTAEGARRVHRIRPRHDELLHRLLSELDPGEQEAAAGFMRRLVETLA